MHSKYNGYSFPLRDTVKLEKVHFRNRYGIELCGDLYLPAQAGGKLAAVAVSGPFGAVKEQCSGLYAEELASRGFAALAFDPSFTGESGGEVRNVASPDINTEDFSAAVDFLITRDFVDGEKVGILGICSWGGMALNAAAMDTRIKATVTATMAPSKSTFPVPNRRPVRRTTALTHPSAGSTTKSAETMRNTPRASTAQPRTKTASRAG